MLARVRTFCLKSLTASALRLDGRRVKLVVIGTPLYLSMPPALSLSMIIRCLPNSSIARSPS